MGGIVPFALVDVDTRQNPADLAAWAEAITIQSQRDFAAPEWGYGVGAALAVRASASEALPGERLILLMAQPDQPGALGYHDPARVIKVFPTLEDILDDVPVTISHEVLEFLGDADCGTLVLGPDGKLRLREAADPVEDVAYSYVVTVSSGRGVKVSDFVGTDYFDGGAPGAAPRYDVGGYVRSPGEVLSGGYQTLWDAQAGFTQATNGTKRAYRRRLDDLSARGLHSTRADLARLALAGKVRS